MDAKNAFIESYATSWLAAYAVSRYQDACYNGDHSCFDSQPVEDAYFIAELAWKSRVSIIGDPMSEPVIKEGVLPTVDEAKARLAVVDREAKLLRAFIRTAERLQSGAEGEE